jgi:hypothetical protein|tara:strand:+ start:108 stop:362 length:255 start_codon:yes stop_codon:yes gene_type:complete
MTNDLKLEDQQIKRYTTIDGKQVPVIEVPTKIIITNKKTGTVYSSETEAQEDVINAATDTTEEDIQRDISITVANLSIFGATNT